MNPYEVLGIRPKAADQEIELAYRSRRTQYHPDKYDQSDAETVRWATTQMQAVNAAYAMLSDGRQRGDVAGSGQSAATANAAPEPEPTPTRNDPPVRASLSTLLRARLAPYAGFSRIFFAPRIPEKKLHAAHSSYGQDIPAEDILVLVDATVFGGAKEGALLTGQGMRSKELACSPYDLPWTEIREIELRGAAIWVNGYQVFDCTMVDKAELVRLVGVLREFLAELGSRSPTSNRSSGRAASASATPWADPLLCQSAYVAAIGSFTELCDALDQTAGPKCLDRAALVRFFEAAADVLQHPSKAKLAYRYLRTVELICNAALAVLAESDNSIDGELLRNRWDDPPVIRGLREMLTNLLQG